MKNKSILKKVSSKKNYEGLMWSLSFTVKGCLAGKESDTGVYYTLSDWNTRIIEGITFVPVVKEVPSEKSQHTFWLREDNMEYLE